jgi:ABC-type Zn uptake system ZnuABC Zn-binding protein ZnuA
MRQAGRPLARWAAAGAALFLISGCGSDEGGEGVSVVATTPIVGDLARNVAGDDAEVATLLRPNTDPHEYEPRPDDVEALAGADLVIASGGDLDEWVADAISDSGSSADLVVLADEIPHALHGGHAHAEEEHAAEDEHAGEDEEEELDPHWWHDPRNAVAAVAAIEAALADLDPDLASSVEERADKYASDIQAVDRVIATSCIDAVPAEDRKIVTDHDAFAYLGARYGIEIVGSVIPATTTEAQASAGELADLRATIEREGVKAVFPETSVSSDLAATIAEETGASADNELYGDTLGPEGSDGATYLEMISANGMALLEGMSGGETTCAIFLPEQ